LGWVGECLGNTSPSLSEFFWQKSRKISPEMPFIWTLWHYSTDFFANLKLNILFDFDVKLTYCYSSTNPKASLNENAKKTTFKIKKSATLHTDIHDQELKKL
jgi:hypothetical protein